MDPRYSDGKNKSTVAGENEMGERVKWDPGGRRINDARSDGSRWPEVATAVLLSSGRSAVVPSGGPGERHRGLICPLLIRVMTPLGVQTLESA